MTLIHLISGETLQNVLPILALKPAKVISVLSNKNEVFLKKKADIENAVRLAMSGCGQHKLIPEFDNEPTEIGFDSPTIEQTKKALTEVLSAVSDPCVNYTGGTKEMSIGAWCAAKEAEVPSLYCDSPREFRSGETGKLKFPQQLSEIASRLELPTILAAQGLLEGTHWKKAKTTGARIRFGQIAYELGQTQPQLMRGLRAAIREHGIKGGQRKPNSEDYKRASTQPLPVRDNELTHPFLDAAQRTGLIKQKGGQWFLLLNSNGNAKERSQRLQFVLTQLDGGAFEGYVHHCLEQSTRYSRFIHGLMPYGTSEDAGFGETDFLAFEPLTTGLTLITCKSSPPSLEHLESVLARKNKLGGRFAKAMLCVERGEPRRIEELRRQASSLGIECVVGEELASRLGAKLPLATSVPAKPFDQITLGGSNLADAFK